MTYETTSPKGAAPEAKPAANNSSNQVVVIDGVRCLISPLFDVTGSRISFSNLRTCSDPEFLAAVERDLALVLEENNDAEIQMQNEMNIKKEAERFGCASADEGSPADTTPEQSPDTTEHQTDSGSVYALGRQATSPTLAAEYTPDRYTGQEVAMVNPTFL